MSHFSELRMWRQNSGKIKIRGASEKEAFEAEWTGGKSRPDRWFAGLPKGAADLGGILGPNGLSIQIEVKGPKEKQTPGQKKWQRMVEMLGGLYVVVEYDEKQTMLENVEAGYAGVWRAIRSRS